MSKNRIRLFAIPMLGAAFVTGAGGLFPTLVAHAQTSANYDPAAVQKGLQISPVPVDTAGRDRNQVGYGSYLVNAAGGCNDCHTNPNWKADGDPYKGMPKAINTAGYLAGGIAFGPFTSRNITPSVEGPTTGSLTNFKEVMRKGTDLRKLHEPISPLLQVMPWPVYGELTDNDLDAIFAYLSSIPCVEGGPEEKPNRCGRPAATTTAVAEPKNATVVSTQINLDGTKSTSADGQPLTYSWKNMPGTPPAAILRANSATPTVQFATGPVTYKFELTVTDTTGKTATDTVTINYARSW